NPTGNDTDGTVENYKITSLPIGGTLFLADGITPVTLNQVLTVAEANGLKFDPDGTTNDDATFNIAAIDNDGDQDATPATITIPLGNVLPTTDDITSASISSDADATDIVNPTGNDTDGTVENYKITSLPSGGTLFLADGITPVTLNQVLTVAQANGLKFDPDGTTNDDATFNIAAIDNDSGEDATSATITIPLENVLPTTDDLTSGSISSDAGATDIVNPTGNDTDGTVENYKITSLPSGGTLFLADGITPVTLNQVLTVAQANGLKFDPDGTTNDDATFNIAAIDNDGDQDASPATITIPLENVLPTTDDLTSTSISSNAGATDIVNPTGNDTDGTVENYKITSLPTGGTLFLADGITPVTLNQVLTVAQANGLKFDPDGTTNDDATFNIAAIDNDGDQDASPATITIPLENVLPTTDDLTSGSISSNAGATDIVNPTGNDTDGTVENYKITSLPTGGTLFLADGITPVTLNQVLTVAQANGLKFDPDGTTNDDATFNIAAIDNDGGEDATPAIITIPLGNVLPTTDDLTSTSISSDADATDIVNPTGNDTDGTVENYKITSLPSGGTLFLADGITPVTLNQVLTVAQANGLKFDPDGTTNDDATFNIAAIDNDSGEDATSATITIPLGNVLPTTDDLTSASISSDAGATDIVNPTGNDTDGTVENYKITSLPTGGTLFLADGITPVTLNQVLTVAQANGLKFDPDGTANDDATFNIAAIDNDGDQDASPATITIPLGNVLPTTDDLTSASISSNADATDIVNPTGNDTDGTVENYKITSLPSGGTLFLADGITPVTLNQVLTVAQANGLKFDPDGTTNDDATFNIAAIDNDGDQDASPAIITIPLENVLPTTDDLTSASISSNADATDIVNPTGNDTDGTVENYKITSLPSGGTLFLADGITPVTLNQVLTVAQANGLKFDPDGTTNDDATFNIAAIDNDRGEDATPATITIPLENVLPTTDDLTSASISSDAGATDIVNPTGNDTDGTVENYKITSLPSGGTLFLADGITPVTLNQVLTVAQANGLKFDPDGTTNDDATFNIAAIDNDRDQDATSATITIPLENVLPTTDDLTSASISSNAGATDIVNPTGNDTDGTVENYKITSLPSGGTLFLADGITPVMLNQVLTVAQANGLKFDPDGTTNDDATFNIAAIDNDGDQDASPAIITIPLGNDENPIAENDTASTLKDTPVTTGNVLENDSVLDNATITSFDATSIKGGTVVINGDGTFDYTPALGFVGEDTFTYTICDDDKPTPSCSTATVTVAVTFVITAIVDDYSENPTEQGANTPVITENDVLDGSPVVVGTAKGEVTLTADPNGTNFKGFTFNPDGTITVSKNVIPGTYNLEYEICENGSIPTNCAIATVTIVVVPEANPCGTPYNIMTPDNDGENDSFFISCIDKPEYANNTVEIFNRWGNTVYKASGYNNESVSFKGISNGRTTLVVDEKLPV
ncbi:gliding motility-associated C-terminal domain-containing protein, partial [Tenacibaculum finnmarkense]|uniref:Ig-like domain-containing protein n=1 Tax=Tenacibaculum finnmarkense TaxID=2781243 RepID=UPI001EFA5AA5